MLKLLLWLRYLRKKKLIFLSIAAVSLAVALLIVVDSLFAGFIKGLEKTDIWGQGDITLITKWVPKYESLIDELEKIDGVKAAGPYLSHGGLLRLDTGDVREALLRGVDLSCKTIAMELKKSLLRQKTQPGQPHLTASEYPEVLGGWVGIAIVTEPNAITDRYDFEQAEEFIGQRLLLTTSGIASGESDGRNARTTAKPKLKALPFRVTDIFHSGVYQRDKTVYLEYAALYKAIFTKDSDVKARFFGIRVKDGVQPETLRADIWHAWQKFASKQLSLDEDDISHVWVETRTEQYEPFLAELRKQMGLLLLIFGVICSVVVLLVFCIFCMIVQTKQKDIAVIKSCGASSASAALIFTGFGACVGVVGSAAGIVLGTIVIRNINTIEGWIRVVFGIKFWRSSVYIFDKIPNQVDWSAVWWVVLAAVMGCILGSLIPAIIASRVDPVKILRYE